MIGVFLFPAEYYTGVLECILMRRESVQETFCGKGFESDPVKGGPKKSGHLHGLRELDAHGLYISS